MLLSSDGPGPRRQGHGATSMNISVPCPRCGLPVPFVPGGTVKPNPDGSLAQRCPRCEGVVVIVTRLGSRSAGLAYGRFPGWGLI